MSQKVNCPHCSHPGEWKCLDPRKSTPNPGDTCVCASCSNIMTFTDTLGVRKATPEETKKFDENIAKAMSVLPSLVLGTLIGTMLGQLPKKSTPQTPPSTPFSFPDRNSVTW